MCKCGCRGNCTLWPLLFAVSMDFVNQNFENLVLVPYEARSDWPAWIEVGGFRLWNHSTWPCPCCDVDQEHLLSLLNISLHSIPYTLYTHESYDRELARTFKVARSYEPLRVLRMLLVWILEPENLDRVSMGDTRK